MKIQAINAYLISQLYAIQKSMKKKRMVEPTDKSSKDREKKK